LLIDTPADEVNLLTESDEDPQQIVDKAIKKVHDKLCVGPPKPELVKSKK
jgi:hypothetical protein